MGAVARTRSLTRLAAGVLLLCAQRMHAQLQPELRVDALGPAPYVVQSGAGVTLALGYYARVTAVVAGAPQTDDRYIGDHWRGDVIARVLLDPFKQQRWALSLGGGLSVRRQTYLAAIVDLEGPAIGGVMPALQAGVGGGVRAGVVLRRAMRGRR